MDGGSRERRTREGSQLVNIFFGVNPGRKSLGLIPTVPSNKKVCNEKKDRLD